MRFLFFCHSEILNPIGGASEYIRELVTALSKDHDIDVVTWGDFPSYDTQKSRLHVVHFESKQFEISFKERIKNAYLKEILSSIGLDYYISIFLQNNIVPLSSFKLHDSYDLIVVISFESPKAFRMLSKEFNAPIIEMPLAFGLPWYLNNNKDWFRFIGRKSVLTSRLWQIIMRISNLFLEILEIHRLSSNNVIAVSKLDAMRMSYYLGQKIDYLNPTVLGLQDISLLINKDERIRAIFLSTPGVSASISVEYLLKVSKILSSVYFMVTGIKPLKEQLNEVPKNLNFLGWLEASEFEAALKSAHIVLIPSIQGSGVQTKLLKSMAFGKAIITTSAITKPFENLRNGEHLIIEDDPVLFVTRIKYLVSDIEKIRVLGINAYKYYYENFNQKLTANKFMEIVNVKLLK